MISTLECMKLASEESRLRILLLLHNEELSVAELQDILNMGQSRISMQLAKLKQGGLIVDRRIGKSILYRLSAGMATRDDIFAILTAAAVEVPEAAQDAAALQLALRKRKDRMRSYFDELAGKFGRDYVPG